MNDIVISDTTALIILAKSDAFALLSNLFQKIYIPQAVYDELMFKDDIVNYRIKAFDNIELKPVSDMATLERIKRLKIDKGEVEAISLALELNLMLIIDERKGRKIAINQGLKIVGVLGILIENYRKKFLTHDEVKLKFLLFKEQGLRISEQLEKLFFEKLDE
jgi:predicted nucleic acid-binding protein